MVFPRLVSSTRVLLYLFAVAREGGLPDVRGAWARAGEGAEHSSTDRTPILRTYLKVRKENTYN